jgi:hypothetical protein
MKKDAWYCCSHFDYCKEISGLRAVVDKLEKKVATKQRAIERLNEEMISLNKRNGEFQTVVDRIPMFEVHETKGGPGLWLENIMIKSWLGTVHNTVAHALCSTLNERLQHTTEVSGE